MASLWRFFSNYVPTVRDDGREFELPIVSSSRSSRTHGQRHDRPRSSPHAKDMRARWAREDEEEVQDLALMTRPRSRNRRNSKETKCSSTATSSARRREPAKHSNRLPTPQPDSEPCTKVLRNLSKDSETQSCISREISKSWSQDPGHDRRRSARICNTPEEGNQHLTEPVLAPSAHLLALQRELEQLQSDLSSTKLELEHQRSVNVHLLSQKSKQESELAQVSSVRAVQTSEIHALRAALANCAVTTRSPDARDEELAALKAFLNKTDEFSGAQILQTVQDLNAEIVQLAAAVSEEFPLARHEPPAWSPAQAELVRSTLGDGMLALLRDGDFEEDPSAVQLAVQAWEVHCCQNVLDAFCVGVAPEVDMFLRAIFEEMQATEPQAMASRWRALTHMHTRNFLAKRATTPPEPPPPSSASSTSSCIPPLLNLPHHAYPTPESTNINTPASLAYSLPSVSLAPLPCNSARVHLNGLLAILALAGCTDERGTSTALLAERFGNAIGRICESSESLARSIREGVASAWFAVRAAPVTASFEPAAMENMYAGFGDETADVLCTVALGLEVIRKKDRGVPMGAPSGEKGEVLDRTMLLKPKVVLESVRELL